MPPKQISPEELAGLKWSLKEFEEEKEDQILVLKQQFIYKDLDGTPSLRFSNYKKKQIYSKEEEEEEFNMMNWEDDPIFDELGHESEIYEEDLIGYFLEEDYEEPMYDTSEETVIETEETGFKMETVKITLQDIRKRKFIVENI